MDQGSGARRSSKPSPLKLSKESRTIRKPPVPVPATPYRQPVIIHTYSPKVIETDATNFMWLVQSLTGSSDTRMRCKSSRPASSPSSKSRRSTGIDEPVDQQQQQQQQQQQRVLSSSPSSDEAEDLLFSNTTTTGDDDDRSSSLSDQPHHLKLEQHLLLSPASSTDSGNPFYRLLNPLLASPKSPLVSFDACLEHHLLSNPFSTTSSLASNTEHPSVYVPTMQHQAPWSPILTPGGLSHDFLPDIDLYSSADFHCVSPRSKLVGSIQSPATMAFRDMAFAFVKDAC